MKLVLLHALPLDASMWAAVVEGLDQDVVAPTLYGFGDSMHEWAQGVLDHAGDGPLMVVGNSVGGSCAVEVARLAPNRVKGLVLVGMRARHRPEPLYRDAALRLLEQGGMEAAWRTYWAPLLATTAPESVVHAVRDLACAQSVEDVARGVRVFHTRPDRGDFLSLHGR